MIKLVIIINGTIYLIIKKRIKFFKNFKTSAGFEPEPDRIFEFLKRANKTSH